MTALCPHCGAAHDIAARFTGEKVWCSACNGWFLVRFLMSGARLEKSDPPATWPKEKQGK